MEALLRWNHPHDGMISPMTFIPEAERSGAIVPIGAWVLEQACEQLAHWQRSGAPELTVAVNVAARQLSEPGFADVVRRALARAGIEPRLLELEITESAAFEDAARARTVLAELADLGVRILIDDFGSGYSSLNRLKTLPVDGIKIDRFLVQNIADDPRDAAIVLAIVSMARALGIEVVAEGVETVEQLAQLRNLPWNESAPPICNRAQGFLLGRPAPPEQITFPTRAAPLAEMQNSVAS
jgi:EAL domain-containing protein (putative c-di-GMP-specific phosphodiesterase class I)